MKTWVIMGNDYPAAVAESEAAAENYIEERKREDIEKCKQDGRDLSFGPRIYWRSYEFETIS